MNFDCFNHLMISIFDLNIILIKNHFTFIHHLILKECFHLKKSFDQNVKLDLE